MFAKLKKFLGFKGEFDGVDFAARLADEVEAVEVEVKPHGVIIGYEIDCESPEAAIVIVVKNTPVEIVIKGQNLTMFTRQRMIGDTLNMGGMP